MHFGDDWHASLGGSTPTAKEFDGRTQGALARVLHQNAECSAPARVWVVKGTP